MYRLFKTGRSTPINESDTSPLRKTPKATTRPSVKAIDYAYESPTRPPRPALGLYDTEEVEPITKLTHTRSSSCPLSFSLDDPFSRPRSSSTPQLLEALEPSTPIKPKPLDAKRRPVALKLQTSNLINAPSRGQESEVAPPRPDFTEKRLKKRTTRSAGDLDKLISTHVSPLTPVSTQSFENVPLPWALVSPSTIPHRDLQTYLQQPSLSPRILPPFVLSTCEAESQRLHSELDHLKVKYGKLLLQRDNSLHQLQVSDARSIVQLARTLKKQITRCDRLAKQMHVCNDQIRQMETQMAEHRMGVWKLGQRKRDTLITMETISFPLPPTRYESPSSDGSSPEHYEVCDVTDIETSHTCDSDAILILPPSHSRSRSIPFDFDFPHTPRIDHRGEALSQSGTAPLRFIKSRAERCTSLIEAGREVRRPQRESDWVSSQAILMSLATAELWARP